MPAVLLSRGNDGKLAGATTLDQVRWQRWRLRVEQLQPGECLAFSWSEPRSGPFHRRHMAIIAALFEAQEQFADFDIFRKWLEVGASHCDFAPGPKGQMCAIPRSIAYDKLGEPEFRELHEAITAFIRSEHACAYLYPHLHAIEALRAVNAVLEAFL